MIWVGIGIGLIAAGIAALVCIAVFANDFMKHW